jgi:glyoxylase-like metal-dependent hydrolase (beta-lactamase superfamily II)
MKQQTLRVVLVAMCSILCAGAALSQDQLSGPIPTGGPIPDNRGFRTDDKARVAKVEIVTRHISGQAYVVAGAGGNMVVFAGDDGIMLVDTNFKIFFDRILSQIRRISDKPIRYVFNTHPHGDHAENNENFAKLGAVVIGHPNFRKAMMSGTGGVGSPVAPGAPVMTTTAPLTFHFNGEEVILMPIKVAHTDADMVVYFKQSDVFVFGDVYRTDYPSLGDVEGATIESFLDNYQMALDMTTQKTIFVPGHGQLSTWADLNELRGVVVQLYARFRDMVTKGMTLEEIIAARPSKEWDARFASENKSPTTGNTVERVYTRMYNAVKKELAAGK